MPWVLKNDPVTSKFVCVNCSKIFDDFKQYAVHKRENYDRHLCMRCKKFIIGLDNFALHLEQSCPPFTQSNKIGIELKEQRPTQVVYEVEKIENAESNGENIEQSNNILVSKLGNVIQNLEAHITSGVQHFEHEDAMGSSEQPEARQEESSHLPPDGAETLELPSSFQAATPDGQGGMKRIWEAIDKFKEKDPAGVKHVLEVMESQTSVLEKQFEEQQKALKSHLDSLRQKVKWVRCLEEKLHASEEEEEEHAADTDDIKIEYMESSDSFQEEETWCDICLESVTGLSEHRQGEAHKAAMNACSGNRLLKIKIQNQLLPCLKYQCTPCSFYCNELQVFLNHIMGEDHTLYLNEIQGTLSCMTCQKVCFSNIGLRRHLRSQFHRDNMREAGEPCIIENIEKSESRSAGKKGENSKHSLGVEGKEEVQDDMEGKEEVQDDMEGKEEVQDDTEGKEEDNWEKDTTENENIGEEDSTEDMDKKSEDIQPTMDNTDEIPKENLKEKVHVCPFCRSIQTSMADLQTHLQDKHSDVMRLKFKNSNNDVLVPIKPATEKKEKNRPLLRYPCKFCPLRTKTFSEFRCHTLEEHYDLIDKCCGLVFVTETLLKAHQKSKMHAKFSENVGSNQTPNEGRYICKKCGAQLPNEKAKIIHEFHHSSYLTEKAAFSADPYFGIPPKYHEFVDTIRHQSFHDKAQCPVCDNVMTINTLFGHLRNHENMKPYLCPLCSSSFSGAQNLRSHLKSHLAIGRFTCEECGKVFTKKGRYEIHKISKHFKGDAEPFKKNMCKFCGKKFFFKTQMVRHEKLHGAFEVRCTTPGCGKVFTSRQDYQLHRKSAHVHKVSCPECNWTGRSENLLKEHMAIHGLKELPPIIYNCEQCEYSTIHKSNLTRHMVGAKHRNRKTTKPVHKCPFCDFEAKDMHGIASHIKTNAHPGQFLFSCKYCKYRTDQTGHFTKHLKTLHNLKITAWTEKSLLKYTKLYEMVKTPGKKAAKKRRVAETITEEEFVVDHEEVANVSGGGVEMANQFMVEHIPDEPVVVVPIYTTRSPDEESSSVEVPTLMYETAYEAGQVVQSVELDEEQEQLPIDTKCILHVQEANMGPNGELVQVVTVEGDSGMTEADLSQAVLEMLAKENAE